MTIAVMPIADFAETVAVMHVEHQAEVVRLMRENAELRAERDELIEALKGVVAVADRKTDEFDRARAVLKGA